MQSFAHLAQAIRRIGRRRATTGPLPSDPAGNSKLRFHFVDQRCGSDRLLRL